jgi:integrase
MGRRFILTYDKSLKHWVKRVNGRKVYLGKGSSKTNQEDYQRAVERYYAFLKSLETDPRPNRTPRSVAKSVQQVAGLPQALQVTPARSGLSIKRVAEKYHEHQASRVGVPRESGGICAARAKSIVYWLRPFLESFGDAAMSSRPLGDFLSRFRAEQLEQAKQGLIANNTLFQRFATLKNFLRWSWEREYLRELPRNFRSDLMFGIPLPKEIHFFEWRRGRDLGESEIQRLLNAVVAESEMLELCVLLGLNAGFGMSEIAGLKMEEVLWRQKSPARIKRKRSKTGVRSNHLLWDRTLHLLKKYADGRYGSSELCLQRSGGTSLLSRDKGIYTSSIARTFKEVVRSVFGKDDPRSFKTLRKTTATYCRHRMAGTDILFLAHTPYLMSEKYYTTPSYASLDEVLCYCECDFGLRDTVSDRWQKARLLAPPDEQ